MTQTLKTTERLGVVDALRGFALLAIVLLHNLEHYNLFLPLDYTLPAWLQTIDKYAWDTMFFLFAGKAYATFSLLFGFSFYIQFHNAEKRGTDFRGRFAWRMCLLFLFAHDLRGGCACFSCLHNYMPCSTTGIFFCFMQ